MFYDLELIYIFEMIDQFLKSEKIVLSYSDGEAFAFLENLTKRSRLLSPKTVTKQALITSHNSTSSLPHFPCMLTDPYYE